MRQESNKMAGTGNAEGGGKVRGCSRADVERRGREIQKERFVPARDGDDQIQGVSPGRPGEV